VRAVDQGVVVLGDSCQGGADARSPVSITNYQ